MKTLTTRLLPKDGETCGWYNVLPAAKPGKTLTEDVAADWIVVGGGFTGLACARRLSELHPDDQIVVLEAQRIGQGNSGRNSGWLLNFNSFGGDTPEMSRVLSRLQQAGLDHLTDVASQHEIKCDWLPWGTLCFGLNGNEHAHLEKLKANCRAAGQPFEEWSAEETRERLGVKRASKAFFQPGTVLVNPAALVRGLGENLPDNVTVYENSAVLNVINDGQYTVKTAEGSVTAKKLMICANGFTPAVLDQRSDAVPIAAYSVISRKLTQEELAILGTEPGHSFISPIGGDSLFRKTLDGRLMCRQNWVRYLPSRRFSEQDYQTVRDYAREAIRLRWPEMANIEIEHTWGGVINMTRNQGFLFGQVADGLYMTGICNGAHNTRGTISGRLLADYASGVESSLLADQLTVPKPKRLPPPPFVRIGATHRIRTMMRTQRKAYQA